MILFSLFSSLTLAYIVWWFVSLVTNYRAAKKMGFPILISPISALNPIWMLCVKYFPVVFKLRYLPYRLGDWSRCKHLGWTFSEDYHLHEEYGPIFTIVTPSRNEVIIGDHDAAHIITSRRRDFVKPAEMYKLLNVFGPNLNTVEGHDWSRQRRLTAPYFNEKTSSWVWAESLRQTQSMGLRWHEAGERGTRGVASDTSTLTLHVLTAVGFGQAYDFNSKTQKLPAGHTMSYRDVLQMCISKIFYLSLTPTFLQTCSFMPARLKTIYRAGHELRKYMEDLLAAESKSNKGMSNTLIGGLAKASLQDDTAALSLSNEEVMGNIFIFSLAGHETTAGAVSASLLLLAAHEDVQQKLILEIDAVLQDHSIEDYANVFPRLQYCLAIMHETLRLYGSIIVIPKNTSTDHRRLDLNGRIHLLPPRTAVNINIHALHTSPHTWGPDPLTWRPDRWLQEASTSNTLKPHLPGSFMPWSDGPRVCVGRKFSQVEFVAVLAHLFSRYRVAPRPNPGQSVDEARRAVDALVRDSTVNSLTLRVREPERIPLIWERRGGK